jgi:hypothetical protein
MTKIFVFGSNLRGIHGAGAAKSARIYHGAIMGQGEGLQGNSYAIPTKDENLTTRDLGSIESSVDKFIEFAKNNPDKEFLVTKVGCGLAKIPEARMKKMFVNAPQNCKLPEGW